MSLDGLKQNQNQMREILREIYVFTNQIDAIKNLETGSQAIVDPKEKKLLTDSIFALTNQLRILNNSLFPLTKGVSFYQKLDTTHEKLKLPGKEKIVQVSYSPEGTDESISLAISDKDKKEFLENLSKSRLSINQLKKKYAVEKPIATFGKPNAYAKLSNHFFRNLSYHFIANGYFKSLNRDLRKMNSPFVLGTYVSMIFFSVFLSFIAGGLILLLLLFFSIGIEFPFLGPVPEGDTLLLRFTKFFWILFTLPFSIGLLMYFYPSSEGKSLGARINQELPFVAIHMSAIASSGVEPISIFKIILRSKEYKYTNREFRKLLNLINFHGEDLISALKKTAIASPSLRLKELLEGLATAVTSGGVMHEFLDKHAETLLFDYRLEREKYTKTSETFMDIYISIVIAAPMILLMLFVIMGSTGSLSSFLGFSTEVVSILIILGIMLLNVGFLLFLRVKQPTF